MWFKPRNIMGPKQTYDEEVPRNWKAFNGSFKVKISTNYPARLGRPFIFFIDYVPSFQIG